MKNPLLLENIYEKLNHLESATQAALLGQTFEVPLKVVRDVSTTLDYKAKKSGLSTQEGQARLFHDLANIELQAMELGLRTLFEFPNSPQLFREELIALTFEEAFHLKLCLQQVERLGFCWGHWSAPPLLWDATHATDSLTDRILIVHRYLEGSGLDASQEILKKLSGVQDKTFLKCVEQIAADEIKHVQFGNKWFHFFCQQQGLDPLQELKAALRRLDNSLPLRNANLNKTVRLSAGFIEEELAILQLFMKNRSSAKLARAHKH